MSASRDEFSCSHPTSALGSRVTPRIPNSVLGIGGNRRRGPCQGPLVTLLYRLIGKISREQIGQASCEIKLVTADEVSKCVGIGYEISHLIGVYK